MAACRLTEDLRARMFPGACVALYRPLADEADPQPLADMLGVRHILSLPVVTARGAPLVFRRWAPGDPLAADALGVPAPVADAPEVTPDAVVCPLLAFDRAGGRLGFGGGYYDRTLALLKGRGPLVAVGFAYAVQEVPSVPVEPHDARLDWIVTEREAIEVDPRAGEM